MRVFSTAVMLVAVPLVHGGIPWMLSRWGPRWGWTAVGAPGIVNLMGMAVVASGVGLLVWILRAALAEVPRMPERSPLGLRPAALLQNGPYAWSRHPLYLAEMLLWLGMGIYFGSPVVLVVLGFGVGVVGLLVIPREERALELYFGDEYRAYRERVRFPRF
jgi:protein-S-isoprenylcysteine O-methyltransferase Ste14